MDSIPVVDLSRPESLIEADLMAAYGTVGFAYLVGHEVDDSDIEAVFAEAKRFHGLPGEAKRAIALDHNHRGFIAIDTSTDVASELATVTKPNQSESFMMMREAAPDDPDVVNGVYLAGPNQWPDLDGFRPVLERYHDQMVALGRRLIDRFMAALGQSGPPAGAFDRPTTWLRLLHYPPSPPDADPDLYGSAPHVDFGAITVLAQDDVGGLQVRTIDQTWIDVPPQAGAFVMNTGSVMRRWSNGRLPATPHRVINRSGRERYSVPFFFDPHVDMLIKPLPGMVDDGQGARFGPVRFGDVLRAELAAGYDRHAAGS